MPAICGCYDFGPVRIDRYRHEAVSPEDTASLRFERGWVFPRAAVSPEAGVAPPELPAQLVGWPALLPGEKCVVFLEHEQSRQRTAVNEGWSTRVVIELTDFRGGAPATLDTGAFRAYFVYHGGNAGPHGEWSRPGKGVVEITHWNPGEGRMKGRYDLTFECERLGWWRAQRETELVRVQGGFDVRTRATPKLGEAP